MLLWKKPEDWANVFIKWVRIPVACVVRRVNASEQAHNNGMRDSIFTLYELRNGENTVGEGTRRTQAYSHLTLTPQHSHLTPRAQSFTVLTCAS